MVIVFKVSPNIQEKMKEFYKDLMRPTTPPYSVFQAQSADVVVTLYESGKVMFQGISADIEASIWKDQEMHLNNRNIDAELKKKEEKKEKTKEKNDYDTKKYTNISSIGSDEVGTGDYFGPVIVTATFVPKEKEINLMNLGIKDSKQITDDTILKLAPQIIKEIEYKTFLLNNKDFNKYTALGYNMNKIKAILHNKVLYALKKEHINEYDKIIVDQFTPPKSYFGYLSDATEIVRDIDFTPKAENKSLAVACSSIISRYLFIKEIDKMSNELNINLPKGAGEQVDDTGVKIATQFGLDKLNEIAKVNFKNTEKIKEKMANK